MKKLLILGIDPGTTVGYAVLDIEGNCLELKSHKELSPDQLTNILSNIGKPLIIGTDKAKIPNYVRKIATTFNAVIVKPTNDLTTETKTNLVNLPTENAHEKDALAAANYAFNDAQSIIKRVRKTLFETDQINSLEEVLTLVVKRKISIKDALKILNTKELPKEKITQEIKTEPIAKTREIELLKRANEYLKKENENLRNLLTQKTEPSHVKIPILTRTYRQTILRLKRMTSQLKQELCEIENLCLRPPLQFMLRIPHLGNREAKQISQPHVYVDDPTKYSENAIQNIQTIIISPLKPPFPSKWINAKELKSLILTPRLVAVDKTELEHMKYKKETIANIIEEYRKDRV